MAAADAVAGREAGSPVAAEVRNSTGISVRTRSTTLTLDALDAHGEAIGRALRAPALVTLTGELGAGKTTLTQAICRGLGVTGLVTSPTFSLIHEYDAPAARVVHCDLYRLDSVRAVASLGLDDMLGDPSTIVIVEWPERAGALLPQASVQVTLEHVAVQPDVRVCTEVWAR